MGSGREARGKENPRVTYAVGFRTEPATLVRGSSRRITIMRFRPANIRVINRRRSPSIGHSLCPYRATLRIGGRATQVAAFPPFLLTPVSQNAPRRQGLRFAAPKPGAPLTAAVRSGELRCLRRNWGRAENQNQHRALDRSLHIRQVSGWYSIQRSQLSQLGVVAQSTCRMSR